MTEYKCKDTFQVPISKLHRQCCSNDREDYGKQVNILDLDYERNAITMYTWVKLITLILAIENPSWNHGLTSIVQEVAIFRKLLQNSSYDI